MTATPVRSGQAPRSATASAAGNDVAQSLARLARLESETVRLIGRYDHVTRVPNRLQFLDDFAALAGSTAGAPLLMLVTLAEAKHYNEILRALGHAFAEDFVRAGLNKLEALLPPMSPIYHVSVLSFAMMVGHEPGAVPPLARAIAQAFKGDLSVNDIPIKTKVGVGLLPLSDQDPSEALRAALAAAQDSRRIEGGVASYNNKTDAAHRRAFHLLTDLPAALKSRDQLSLVFQPRITLADGAVHGAEALLRWTHPTYGNVPPGEFIPLVEQTSLIDPLTDWVLDAALNSARDFRDHGNPLKISINASPANLIERDFDAHVLELCSSHGLKPDAVEIEFTEGMVAGDSDRAIAQLKRLRDAGIEIAIDDFGTGFANFNYLRRIPADVLKIDQSLIRPLAPGDDFLVKEILTIAKGMGFRVCAEGIETAESFGLLRDLGCDEGQGYFMARPMPADALRTWRYAS
jgi:EAL domain-containing protein (putative c-di-GMP-specific phosphodiesterase class I)